jgi:hypothetical protein
MSLGEFLGSLQPSSKYSVLELDALLPGILLGEESLWHRLLEGTSLQRDRRMREGSQWSGIHRPRDVPPGAWMLDPSHQGLLSPLSPQTGDRSLHQHFALAAALRPTANAASTTTTEYINCLMQGMGIRFRPEQSVATVVDQSLGELTANGYAAGSYWKRVWGSRQPVMAVLGNTTRSYIMLDQVATDLKQALSPHSRGYYNRDVVTGVLPEAEDCQEALAASFDLRDVYRPPQGSGLAADHDFENF